MRFYLHVFVFVGVNLGLQLFVGIVVNNFNEHKPDHSALLTVSQKRWQDLMERIALTRPIKQPPEPRMLCLNDAMMCVCNTLNYGVGLFTHILHPQVITRSDPFSTSCLSVPIISISPVLSLLPTRPYYLCQ